MAQTMRSGAGERNFLMMGWDFDFCMTGFNRESRSLRHLTVSESHPQTAGARRPM
jgi:hypothetical protein